MSDIETKPPAQAPLRDPSHDLLRENKRPLDPIFAPKTVAVIGATETLNSVGRTVLWNLISNPFGGTVYPVNPKRPNVLGIKAYPKVGAIPEKVDLAVIVTPAPAVPGIMDECLEAGVKGVVIISAGFKELGPPGIELERQILEKARRGKIRVIGPNCLGVMNPHSGLNATFAGDMAHKGNVGFISQSGALGTAILDWSLQELVGFSAFISIGSMLDVGWGDLIDYLGNDPKTQSIVIYMETIGDARAFLSAAREVALTKPILVIKAGRTEAAAKAAASHTGSLTGSDEVLDAAFNRTGVLRVNEIADLFYMAEVLAKQPRPKGPRLTLLTNAGGPGVLSTDALISGGGQLADISKETFEALNKFLPPHWSRNNPIDILGDAGPDRYAKALEIAAKDPNSDGLLVILTPQDMTDPVATAEQLKPYGKIEGKPVLASWMGGAEVQKGRDILHKSSIPTFDYPDTAARAFNYMWKYSKNLQSIYETPSLPKRKKKDGIPNREKVKEILEAVRRSNRTLLTEFESKQVLSAYGIPVVETCIAQNPDEAVMLAEKIGFPAVLKLYSQTITHKTDVGGVELSLKDAAAVRSAFERIKQAVEKKAGKEHFQGVTVQSMIKLEGYEIIIGSTLDPQFGPVMLFGSGGQLVEVYKDRALALPPLNATLAKRMMEQTKIFTALKGVRGRKAADMDAVVDVLVRYSHMIVEQKWIKECDINPLLVSAEQVIALDARIIIFDAQTSEKDLPKPAIRPYPIQYVSNWKLKDGPPIHLRPIRPEDEPLIVKFHQTLSERSVEQRYMHAFKLDQRIAHERLTRVCFNDYDRELALVAIRKDASGEEEIIGVGRLSKIYGTNESEFAILISDQWQNKGLGTELLKQLVQIGRNEGLSGINASILPENVEMQKVAEKIGFKLRHVLEDNIVIAEMSIRPPA